MSTERRDVSTERRGEPTEQSGGGLQGRMRLASALLSEIEVSLPTEGFHEHPFEPGEGVFVSLLRRAAQALEVCLADLEESEEQLSQKKGVLERAAICEFRGEVLSIHAGEDAEEEAYDKAGLCFARGGVDGVLFNVDVPPDLLTVRDTVRMYLFKGE